MSGSFAALATHALQFDAQPAAATLFGSHPHAVDERRVVPHMLAVPTRQHSDPMTLAVLLETDDPRPHAAMLPADSRTDELSAD